MNERTSNSTTTLIGEALSQMSALLRSEVDLARAEIDANIKRAATAVGLLVAALVLAITALNVLTGAIVAGLAEAGLEPGWAAFLVGVALAAGAYLFLQKGTNDLKLSSIAPSRTAENIKRDAHAVKGAHDAH